MKNTLSKQHLQKQKVKSGSDDEGPGGAIEMNTIDITEEEDDEVQVVQHKPTELRKRKTKDVNADCNFDVT